MHGVIWQVFNGVYISQEDVQYYVHLNQAVYELVSQLAIIAAVN